MVTKTKHRDTFVYKKDGLLVISKSSVFCFLVGKFTTCSMLQLSIRSINLSFSCFGYC